MSTISKGHSQIHTHRFLVEFPRRKSILLARENA
jgi:hypothetical protein